VLHLHNVSGGIVGGDELQLQIALQENAFAQVTSVGATRIHRRKAAGPPARQTACFNIGQGALLEYLPDAIIPYAGSSFVQHSEFHLSQGAGLIAWETLAAGRKGYGESFSFDELMSATTIYGPTRPLAIERYALRPRFQEMRSAARFGRFEYSATMWVCRVDDEVAARWMPLEHELNVRAQELSSEKVLWGASALFENGVVIRGLACEAYLIGKGLEIFWQMAKQRIWQRPALMPRKVS
jgi:urease accessory protein